MRKASSRRQRWRKSARPRSAQPSNNRSPSPMLLKVSGWSRVRRAARSISGASRLLYAMAYILNTPPESVGESSSLRLASARMKDWTAPMSYLSAAESRAKMLLLEWGISGGTGYSIEIRLFKTSASSDTDTTESPSNVVPFGGWGRENMSLKKGDDVTSTD